MVPPPVGFICIRLRKNYLVLVFSMIVYIMNFCSASKFEYLEKQNTAVLAFFGKVTVVQFLFSYYARPCAQFSFFFGCIERCDDPL